MTENQDFEKDLASIRKLMERSAKFISLSGMSGVMAGVYALAGAAAAYFIVQYPDSFFSYHRYPMMEFPDLVKVLAVGLLVLMASVSTGLLLSARKARRMGVKFWDNTSRSLIVNLAIPVVSGGLFILISVWNGNYEIVSPACLIFYGLALVNASPNLYDEIRYLGYSEIFLGLIVAIWPGYGLVFWSIGFGVLHIAYGIAMYRKYDT